MMRLKTLEMMVQACMSSQSSFTNLRPTSISKRQTLQWMRLLKVSKKKVSLKLPAKITKTMMISTAALETTIWTTSPKRK